MNASGFKDYVTDAIKFWERWRLAYNLVLAAIVIIHFAAGYPASKAALSLDSALGLYALRRHGHIPSRQGIVIGRELNRYPAMIRMCH